MESIDRLREWADELICHPTTLTRLTTIADEIEREVADMVPLPLDADGEVWHVGDFAVGEVNPNNPKAIERMIWYGPDSGWQLETDTIIYPCPDRPRHHHATTVEDVLREFTRDWCNAACTGDMTDAERDAARANVIAEYAAKLTLRGDE